MREPIVTYPGSASPALARTVASGATEAEAPSPITPTADGFVCGVTRALGRSRSGGIAVVITTAAVPGSGCTFKGTLRVVATTEGGADVPLSEPLTVCDYSIATPFGPLADYVLRLAARSLPVITDPGQRVALVWNETDDLGSGGARPAFVLLGWPLVITDEPAGF